MVTKCDECGMKAYASRYKDSFLSFCRNCGYWNDLEESGMYDEQKLEQMREDYPLSGMEDEPTPWRNNK